MKLPIPVLACMIAALPAAALANQHGGNHNRSQQSAPHYQQQAPRYQPQAPRYQQPAPRYQQAAPRYQQPAPRYQQAAPRYQQPAPRYQQAAPRYQQPAPRYPQPARYQYRQPVYVQHDVTSVRLENPRGWSRPWQWNGGRTWVVDNDYWGGGFWGALGIGLSFNDYQVAQNSPGADLLSEYGLQQTTCDQPNLVQIYGPDGGQVCAYPNDLVAPGSYQIDPATLTLVSY